MLVVLFFYSKYEFFVSFLFFSCCVQQSGNLLNSFLIYEKSPLNFVDLTFILVQFCLKDSLSLLRVLFLTS